MGSTICIARLAQSAERKVLNLVVVGSSPTVGVSFTSMILQRICTLQHINHVVQGQAWLHIAGIVAEKVVDDPISKATGGFESGLLLQLLMIGFLTHLAILHLVSPGSKKSTWHRRFSSDENLTMSGTLVRHAPWSHLCDTTVRRVRRALAPQRLLTRLISIGCLV